MNPRVLKPEGFKHLDRVIDLCSKHGIYTILDLHTAPGGQNTDWHSDAGTHIAKFWEHKDFQDRVVWLWEELAKHYVGNTWIAGYNPLNEPTDPYHTRLIDFYDRIYSSIRAIDPHHALFLDGNTWRDSRSVDHRPFVADFEVGAAVFWQNIRLSYTQVWRTKEFVSQRERFTFGSVSLAFSF